MFTLSLISKAKSISIAYIHSDLHAYIRTYTHSLLVVRVSGAKKVVLDFNAQAVLSGCLDHISTTTLNYDRSL